MKALLIMLFVFASIFIQAQSNYYVILRNGKVIENFDINIKRPLFKKPYVEIGSDQKYDLFQVDKLNFRHGYYAVRELSSGRNSDLLEVETEGTISIFYQIKISSNYDPYMGYGMYNSTARKVYYMEKERFLTQKLTVNNVSRAVQDHLPSLEFANKARNAGMITTAGYVAGLALTFTGLAQSKVDPNTGNIKFSPLVFVGLGVSIIPLISGSHKEKNLFRAIMTYNEAHK